VGLCNPSAENTSVWGGSTPHVPGRADNFGDSNQFTLMASAGDRLRDRLGAWAARAGKPGAHPTRSIRKAAVNGSANPPDWGSCWTGTSCGRRPAATTRQPPSDGLPAGRPRGGHDPHACRLLLVKLAGASIILSVPGNGDVRFLLPSSGLAAHCIVAPLRTVLPTGQAELGASCACEAGAS